MAEEQTKDANAGANDAATAEKPAEKTADASSDKNEKGKKPRKRYASASHPSYMDMLTETLTNLGDVNGSSFIAIKKYIIENFDCDLNAHFNSLLKMTIKKAVGKGTVIQTKGVGASGSFKLSNPVETLLSKPTKRQQASAEAAADKAAKEQAAARRAVKAKRPKKKKKHVSVPVKASKAASKRPAPKKKSVKKAVKKPPAKKASKAPAKAPETKAPAKRSGRASRR